jgi:hypothetical protein
MDLDTNFGFIVIKEGSPNAYYAIEESHFESISLMSYQKLPFSFYEFFLNSFLKTILLTNECTSLKKTQQKKNNQNILD